MKQYLFIILVMCLTANESFAQVARVKTIDNGGSGHYKAIAVSETSLPDFVIYRPRNIEKAVKKEGKLPVVVFANGGCANSSINHEKVLTEIASQGYIVIAIGPLQITTGERKHESTDAEMLLTAMDWITAQSEDQQTDYFESVDSGKIAAGGQSCGGAQILAVAGDPRIKTYMMFNAGMGDMEMAGASSLSLKKVNGEIIYIVGGKSDIATNNALRDYESINSVPVAFASLTDGGHMGTFEEEFGGAYAKIALDWLDWMFKSKDRSSVFLKGELTDYPGWTMKSKNFK